MICAHHGSNASECTHPKILQRGRVGDGVDAPLGEQHERAVSAEVRVDERVRVLDLRARKQPERERAEQRQRHAATSLLNMSRTHLVFIHAVSGIVIHPLAAALMNFEVHWDTLASEHQPPKQWDIAHASRDQDA